MSRTLEVCLTPELMSLYDVTDSVVVVVDVLRATTCMVSGLASGVASITPFADLEACRAMKAHGYRIAGERGGAKVEGFDLGNSPYEYMAEENRGQKIATTTTNGTRAIELARHSREVIIGALVNVQAVADYLQTREENILVLCAGWKGRFNLEDTLFAGALMERLGDAVVPTDDAAVAAHTLFLDQQEHLGTFLKRSAHAQRLQGPHAAKDVAFCLSLDQFSEVPVLRGQELLLR